MAYTYEKFASKFEEIGCTLLTSKDDFTKNKMNASSKVLVKTTCGHDRIVQLAEFRKSPHRKCADCTKKLQIERFKISYEQLQLRFYELGAELLTTQEEFDKNNMGMQSKFRIKARCGHEREIVWDDFRDSPGHLCRKCSIIRSNNNQKSTHEHMTNKFKELGCTLLTTKDEYEKNAMDYDSVFKILCTCGHEREAGYVSMTHSPNKKCQDCAKMDMIEIKRKSAKTEDGLPKSLYQESVGIGIITRVLANNFCVEKLNEGCKGDIAIKPKTICDDLWMPIQVKTTEKRCDKGYFFTLKKKQYDMPVLCICVSNDKMWLFNGNDIIVDGLCIGKNSKYNDFKISKYFLPQILFIQYKDFSQTCLAELNIPCSKNTQIEHEYRLIREENLPFLKFEKNNVDGLPYDFKINGLRIQERVTQLSRTESDKYEASLKRNNKTYYESGLCDFFWYHIPDKKHFYVIPEKELTERDYLKTDVHDGKRRMYLYPMKKYEIYWENKYLFRYDNLDRNKLESLFI
jgi:hypothetical protein